MADVKWIRLSVGMFDDEKIKLIEALPEGDALIVIWCKLLCLAGKVNDRGYIYIGQNMPYTDEMLATVFNKPVNTIRLAIQTFERFEMIEDTDNGLLLVNWNTHQNMEGLEQIRENARLRVARYREKQKLLNESPVTDDVTLRNVTVTPLEGEGEVERDIDIDTTTPLPPSENIPYQKIIEDYNFVCTGLPKVRSLTDGRRKAIRARWNEHGEAAFAVLFAAVAASSFLNGKNDRNWLADFDWLMKEANFAKVLEGKYRDKEVRINGNNRAGGGARYVEQHTDDEYAQFYAN